MLAGYEFFFSTIVMLLHNYVHYEPYIFCTLDIVQQISFNTCTLCLSIAHMRIYVNVHTYMQFEVCALTGIFRDYSPQLNCPLCFLSNVGITTCLLKVNSWISLTSFVYSNNHYRSCYDHVMSCYNGHVTSHGSHGHVKIMCDNLIYIVSIGRIFVLEMKPCTCFCHHISIFSSAVWVLGSISWLSVCYFYQ